MTIRDLLQRGVNNICTTAGAGDWLTSSAAVAAVCPTAELLQLYTEASRRVPSTQFSVDPAGSVSSDTFTQWTCVDAVRASLLLARSEAMAPAVFAESALRCYDNGDASEQRSWLRGVALLPLPERFLAVVIDACRTNIVPNFEAVACENPFASRYFPEANFNQLVLKALFNDIRLSRIVGLSSRVNAELARMAADYAAERRAAGRRIPPDIGLAQAGAVHQGTTA